MHRPRGSAAAARRRDAGARRTGRGLEVTEAYLMMTMMMMVISDNDDDTTSKCNNDNGNNRSNNYDDDANRPRPAGRP